MMDLVVIGFGASWYEYDSKKEEFFWNIQKQHVADITILRE